MRMKGIKERGKERTVRWGKEEDRDEGDKMMGNREREE